MNESLGKELTTEELGKAVKSLAKEKAPGTNGIGVEFYIKFWSMISQQFT